MHDAGSFEHSPLVLSAPVKLLNIRLAIAMVLLAVLSFGVLTVHAPSDAFEQHLDGPSPWRGLHDTIVQRDWTEAVLPEQASSACR